MKKILIAIAISLMLNANASLGPIYIYDKVELDNNIINSNDFRASYASEIYSKNEIKNSSANNLYDFLTQNTSIVIVPSYGNPFSQQIDMRGFGLANGYENIAIMINGKKLNNIDGVPQFLANINLDNVKKIEITKGSGSVIYGDGATAGTINIWTNNTNNNSMSITRGNYGLEKEFFNIGTDKKNFSLLITHNNQKSAGFSNADKSGNKTKSTNLNNKVVLIAKVTDKTQILLTKSLTTIDVRYPNSLTLASFTYNPAQSTNLKYTQQKNKLDNSGVQIKHKFNDNINVDLSLTTESKKNDSFGETIFGPYSYLTKYKNKHKKLIVSYQKDNVKVVSGVNIFDNKRIGSKDTTSKNNNAFFIKGIYNINLNSISLGYRKEKISYKFNPDTGDILESSYKLSAYDIGINHSLKSYLTIFANFNKSYQSPSIDRFFSFKFPSYVFNEFIKPTKIETLNIGLNYIKEQTKTKLTLFKSNLTNEMYYIKSINKNTNIDKSHKLGAEFNHKQQLNKKLAISFNYIYTIAKIDEENENNISYNGKDLPGVSKDNITLAIDYKFNDIISTNLSFKYRSASYSAEDFTNNAEQKQKAFNNINLALNYLYSDDLRVFANVQNILEEKNGFWINDNTIYPVNFTRNISIGLDYKF